MTDVSGSSSGKKVAKNTAILIFLRAGIPVLSVFLMLILARKLGTEGIGRYALAYSLLELFNTIGPLGLYSVITREGSRNRQVLEKMLANAMTLGLAVSLVLTVCMIASGKLMGYDSETQRVLTILGLVIAPCTLGYFLEGASVAIEKMNYIAYSTLFEYVFKVGVGVGLLFSGFGLESVMIVAVIGKTASVMLNALLLRSGNIRVGFGFDVEMVRKLLKLCPAFLFIGIFATLYWRIDILMLSRMQPLDDVGLYGAAYRLFNFTLMVPASLALALYPQMTRLMQNNQDQLNRLGEAAIRYMFAMTIPIAVILTFISENSLDLLFGEEFKLASGTLIVLAWALIPYGVVRYNAYLMFSADRQNIDLAINIIMSVLNILLNFFLIPRYSHFGAAVATLVSIFIYALFQGYYIRRFLPKVTPGLSVPWSVVFASAVLATTLWLGMKVNFIFAVFLAGPAYLLSLLVSGFFSKSEVTILKFENLANKFRLTGFFRS